MGIRSKACRNKIGDTIYLIEGGAYIVNGVKSQHVRARCKIIGMERKPTLASLRNDPACGLDAVGIKFCRDRYIGKNGCAWAWILGPLEYVDFWTPVVGGCVIWT